MKKNKFKDSLNYFLKYSLMIKKRGYICTRKGEMAEWSNAAVLKTVEGHTSGGSNPSFSAAVSQVLITLGFFYAIHPTKYFNYQRVTGNK